jgi:hypothetical protein
MQDIAHATQITSLTTKQRSILELRWAAVLQAVFLCQDFVEYGFKPRVRTPDACDHPCGPIEVFRLAFL